MRREKTPKRWGKKLKLGKPFVVIIEKISPFNSPLTP